MRFPLRYKILVVLGFLLASAVVFYTILASSIFKEEKQALLYDLNHSVAVNTASQLRANIQTLADRVRLYVISRLVSGRSSVELTSPLFQSKGVIALQVFRSSEDGFQPLALTGELGQMGRSAQTLDSSLRQAELGGYSFGIDPKNTEKFLLGVKIETLIGQRKELLVAIAQLEGEPIFDLIQGATLFDSYLVNQSGNVLVHIDKQELYPQKDIDRHPLLARAAERAPAASGVDSYEFENDTWYGAYAPLGLANLFFLSQANQSEMSTAIAVLMQRSFLFGLIVITFTFLASILFSQRITRNLQLLTQRVQRMGKGDLDTQIKLSSRDEVQDLATSFNSMVVALRESREKIEEYNRELEDKVELRTKQLKEKNVALEEIQDKLIKTTQLAAAGEMAGRTAHEVLNPLTAALTRIEQLRTKNLSKQNTLLPQQLIEILQAWEEEYRKGGMHAVVEALKVPSQVQTNISLFEEDIANLKELAQHWQNQQTKFGQDLGFLEQQAQRIQRIIDGMRELVRASSFREEISCHEAIEEASLTLSDLAEREGMRLEKSFNAATDKVEANRDEMIQILINLLRNAFHAIVTSRQANPGRQGIIQIQTQNNENEIHIDIVDNGNGIEPEQQKRVFDQGYTTKAPSEGTGLGLAICRRYARAMDGEVELLYSEPAGKGTCFRITIPTIGNKDNAAQ